MFACRDFGILLAHALPMQWTPCVAKLASQEGFWPPHTGMESSIAYWSDIHAFVAWGARVLFPNTRTKNLMPVKKQLHLIRLGPDNFLMKYWNRLTKRCPRT